MLHGQHPLQLRLVPSGACEALRGGYGDLEARVPLSVSAGGDAVRGPVKSQTRCTKTENQTSSIVQHDDLGDPRAGTGIASGGGDWHCQSGPVLLVRPPTAASCDLVSPPGWFL
ncbi:MAG: hypothetical protein ACPIOQ_24475 [Promethearchaeia archaeon]